MTSLATSLWDRFGSLTTADIPEGVQTIARQSMLDWFGCALAGSAEAGPRIVREEFGGVPGPATVIGQGTTTAASHAALINGAAGHALDFDDGNAVMRGHPTVPVMPAVLAVSEELGATGSELLAAFVAGQEIQARLGRIMGGSQYRKGWHTTASIGVFGATAAVGRLLAFDSERFGIALGLAASMSGGLKANFGTMTKPFHAGMAAGRGVTAARLVARGFTANPDAVVGSQGLCAATGLPEARLDVLDDGTWFTTRTIFKYHAACHMTHAAIESAIRLRAAVGDDPIERVTIAAHPDLMSVCGIHRPRTGLEAKFSLTATTTFALLGIDTSDARTFDDSTVARTDVGRLIELVRVDTDPSVMPGTSTVIVEAAGRSHRQSFDTNAPATDLTVQGDRLLAKFRGLATPVLGADATANLIRHVHNVADLDSIGVLAKTLRGN
ncbi:MmgE/PrpD family protein [Nocardia jiangxiensis]|uniref:MmgE/PrpD family protein n=1 Tax=Nocardia jiangxiensis TaxID=282685 RepID=UPI0002D27A50|nr:MmgE/PrpD family protein [Nocardia jiangxiensis]